MADLDSKRIILGVTGGIAAYKAVELARRLGDAGAVVRVVMTESAAAFVTPLTFQAATGQSVRMKLLDSEAESGMDHIEFARWADLVVVAPATANFLARLAGGFADDLLTTLCLATEAPICVAPAMNRIMWSKPATVRNLERLVADGVRVIGPGEGAQACGETGAGRMSEPSDIVAALRSRMPAGRAASGLRVMVTAGPTFEAIDPVRGITNHSSGKMGYAVARAFHDAGAEVTLVSGPVHLPRSPVHRQIDVRSAQEMFDAVHAGIAGQDVFIAVAAVADYRPASVQAHKIKKNEETATLTLVRNPDILASVAALENAPFCVGFAAETRDVETYARGKLQAKGLDLICANDVSAPGGGFNSDENTLTVIGRDEVVRIGPAPKDDVARHLCRLIMERHEQENTAQDS